ncbi:MAG TPA: PQQ-binding-like beta-propeller repeat protein [Roseiflexaceae bacterium]|nr:PQQ-binding-like beta-propeller repeat protein [Roseiflexaceae bacterium]
MRAIVTVKIATALIFVVIMLSAAITFFGGYRAARWDEQPAWAHDLGGAVTTKIIDFDGDKQNELFVQNANSLQVFDASGKERFTRSYNDPMATTMGNVGGSGEKIVAWSPAGVELLDGAGKTLWAAQPPAGTPSRAAVVRFGGGAQIILGNTAGKLMALDADGKERWHAQVGSGDYIRALDEALIGGQRYVVAANHNGMLALFDENGQQRWSYNYGGALRRMRAFDLNGDGVSEIVAGGDSGQFVMLSAAEGNELWSKSLGQAVTEARDINVDGDPKAREVVVGGKDGGVWAFRADGTELWSHSVGEKVADITGVDVDDDGAEEAIVGDDNGGLVLFEGQSGARHSLRDVAGSVASMDAGRLSDSDQLVVADGSKVQVLGLSKENAPLWYSPLLAGGLLSLVIAVAAWFIASIPPKPTLRVAAEDQSVESLQSQRVMLHESMADVERLRKEGEMPEQAYLLRLKELRGELATTEVALQKAGAPVRVETFRCPSCGGALPLGTDRCDYCGQVVIA